MPNWCDNKVEISNEDTDKLQKLVDAINKGNFCKYVVPMPEDLDIVAGCVGSKDHPDQKELEAKEKSNLEKYGYKNWYDFNIAKWGTKWDINLYEPAKLDGNTITFGFDSAWSPPVGVYSALVNQGFSVIAYYVEHGVGFAGVWDNGEDHEIELCSEQVKSLVALYPDLENFIGEIDEEDEENATTMNCSPIDELNVENQNEG